jgi:hypothetical protein
MLRQQSSKRMPGCEVFGVNLFPLILTLVLLACSTTSVRGQTVISSSPECDRGALNERVTCSGTAKCDVFNMVDENLTATATTYQTCPGYNV